MQKTVSYGLKIVNTGGNQAQFRLSVSWTPQLSGGTSAAASPGS